MNRIRYNQELEANSACTKRIMESTKGIGQKSRKGTTKDFFLFDFCFSSKKVVEAEMVFVTNLIFIANKNTKVLCK